MNPKTSSIIALVLLAIAGAIILLNQKNENSPPITETHPQRSYSRVSALRSSTSPTLRPVRKDRSESADEEALIERGKLTAIYMKNASTGFQHTQKILIADLNLSEAEAAELKEILARREKELAALLAVMPSDEAWDNKEIFRNLTALIRNKGLRDDLAGILTEEQLAAFDAIETKREHENVLSRAYSDIGDINSVARLTNSQKPEVVGVLMKRASEKVEHEADTRAFMTLTCGSLAKEMHSASFRGVTTFVHEGLMKEGTTPNIEYDSPEYGKIVLERKAQRIESDLADLRDVLDEAQLTRYREHLEKEPAW